MVLCVVSTLSQCRINNNAYSGDQLDAQSSISGDLLLTTVSELTLIPQKSHHNQAVSCFAINDALPEPIQQMAYLNVQSEFLFLFTHICIRI